MNNTVTITLTLPQRERFLRFLDRCRLDGSEVPAFVEIRNLVAGAKSAPPAPAAEPV
jgi:hypothetical protein